MDGGLPFTGVTANAVLDNSTSFDMLTELAAPGTFMIMARKTLTWLTLLMTSAWASMAQPSGDLGFKFDATDMPVWDLSGVYTLPGFESIIPVQHENSGRLSGRGAAMVRVGNDVAAATYNVSGSVSGSGFDTRAKLSVKLKGRDYIMGELRSFNVNLKYDLTISPDSTLVGSIKGNATYDGLGSEKIDEPVEMALPTGADGSWAVVMNVLTLGKKVAGTGAIVISTYASPDLPVGWPKERVLPTEVKGNYNPATDVSKVKAKGVDQGKGVSVSLEFETGTFYPISLKGKVLGQRVQIN